MNAICNVDAKELYKKVSKSGIPFNNWHTWIEDSLNKEFMRVVLAQNKNKKKGKTNKTLQEA